MTQVTKNSPVFECPACRTDVHGFITVEIEIDMSGAPDNVTGTGKVVGLRVAHDCKPRVTRGHE